MANRKGPEEDKPLLAPMWVVTFGDLISLLVTFFVLLFTFSSQDSDKYRKVSGSLTGAMGVMTPEGKKSRADVTHLQTPSNSPVDRSGWRDKPQRADVEDELVRKMQDPTVFDTKVDFLRLPDGLRISFQGDEFFDPGGVKLSDSGKVLLLELGRMFEGEPVRVILEAHTDPITSRAIRGGDPTTLTRQMARLAAGVLVDDVGWDANRVGAAGMGALVPVADNGSELGRRKNRRLEVQILWDPEGRGRL